MIVRLVRLVRYFDNRVADSIGKMPPQAQPFFHIIGYLTMPATWMVVMVAVAIGQVLHGSNPYMDLFVIVLLPLAALLKQVIRRRRPQTMYGRRIRSHSFPSSHAYTAALAGGQLAIGAIGAGFLALGIIMIFMIVLIGWSRVYLGVHYPSDVVAGWLLGAIVLILLQTINV